MKKILWHCNHAMSHNEGYKTSSDLISSGLVDLGLNISKSIYEPNFELGDFFSKLNIGYEQSYDYSEYDIAISNTLPDAYVKNGKYNIGFTYWETTRIPKSWVRSMNEMDEIWTTSSWAKKVFEDSGVEVPVYSFSLGVDTDLFYPKKRSRFSPFTFMSIGSPSTRKNSQMTVDAYVKLFGGNDDYRLIYKTMGPPDARIYPKTVHVKPLFQHDKMIVIDKDLPLPELADLYDKVNCLVYPTSGEGWGLLPFQSIAKGIPTICTSGTSCEEFANLSVPLDFKWSNEGMFGLYQGNGEWMKPDFNDLCDKMLDVANNYEKYADLTYKNATKKFNTMSWEHAIKEYYDRLCQI